VEVKNRVFPLFLDELGDALARNVESGLRTPWKLPSKIGWHKHCGGSIYTPIVISDDYAVLVCRDCNMRIVIPREINTYAKLRTHFAEFNPDRGGGGNDGGYNDAVREMRVAQE